MAIELLDTSRIRTEAARFLAAAAFRLDNRIALGSGNGVSLPKRPVAPIHIITDFNNHLSPTECGQVVSNIFARSGVLYEAPHMISDIEPFNITDGAFKIYQLLNNQRREGRTGIFVGVVDPGVGSERRGIVVETAEGYTFVGPDNGLFSPALATLTPTLAYKINSEAFKSSSVTFHGRDQFTPIAAEIATGKKPAELPQLGSLPKEELVKKEFVPGQVVEKDGYGNLKLWYKGIPENLDGKRASQAVIKTPRRLFGLKLPWSRSIQITVASTFEDVTVGEWLAYEGSSDRTEKDNRGLIELAVRERAGINSAAGRLRAKIGDVLKVSWRF